jgi:hypothetical protein
MKVFALLFASVIAAQASDVIIGSQGSQSSDPWCGS